MKIFCQVAFHVVLTASLFTPALSFAKVENLANGSFLDGEVDPGLPRQTVVLVFPGGPALVEKNQQGTTEVITDLLAEGPSSMAADDYRRALFMSNAEIKVTSTLRAMFVVVKAPVDKLESALVLAAKTLAEPRMDMNSFVNSHTKVSSQTNQSFEEMQAVVFFYGMRRATLDNSDIYDGSGSPATMKNITPQVVKSTYDKIFDKKHLFFVSSGPGEVGKVAAAINKTFLTAKETPKFSALPGRDVDPADIIKKSPKGVRVDIINKPGATDNQILFVYPELIKRAEREDVVANVAHSLLGGGMTGRLGKTLRKERGLTYHAGSFVGQPGWMIYTFGGDEQVEGLLKGTQEVVSAFKKETLKDQEISEAKATLDNKHRLRYELPGDVLMEKIRLRLFARDENFIEKYQMLLTGVSNKDVQGFVGSKLNTDNGLLVLMGDAAKLKKVLEKAGYKADQTSVIELDQVM